MILSRPDIPEGHRVTSLSLFFDCDEEKIFEWLKKVSDGVTFEKTGCKFYPKGGSLSRREKVWEKFYNNEFQNIVKYQWNFSSKVPVKKDSKGVKNIVGLSDTGCVLDPGSSSPKEASKEPEERKEISLSDDLDKIIEMINKVKIRHE